MSFQFYFFFFKKPATIHAIFQNPTCNKPTTFCTIFLPRISREFKKKFAKKKERESREFLDEKKTSQNFCQIFSQTFYEIILPRNTR